MSGQTKGVSSPSKASTSQESHPNSPSKSSNKTLSVTLLSSEWRSTKGGLSTFNRELAIHLAKYSSVDVCVYLPQCSEEDKRIAASHNVHLIEAVKMPAYDPVDWLSFPPEDHVVDCVIGHGAVLGRQVQFIKRFHPHCKWIQVVHTAPEELGMYKEYEERISKGEKKHQDEVELCKIADQVVAVGPKLSEAFSRYLRPCGKDQNVLNFTPGIFPEFADLPQATEERNSFSVLVFGRGDSEDFQLKGFDIAAQAIAKLKDMSYELVFVGATSGEEEKVAEMLLKQGIQRSQLRVRRFNASREKLAELFCEVDLAIMPSRTEGFGLAALEALSAGLPVLVGGNSGLAEALKRVPFALSCVVASEDSEVWADRIKAVRDKDREMRLGESEIIRIGYAKKYSWKEQCDKLVERMRNITQEGPSKRLQPLKKGKRPLLPPTGFSPPKQPRLSSDAGSARRCQRSKKGKLPLSSSGVSNPIERQLTDAATENAVVVKMLRAEYERRSKLKPLSWLNTLQLPLKNVYTRLRIISRRKADFQVEDDEVDMYDIFKAVDEGDNVKMTLAEGNPGAGKTTFCLKIAYDWAREEIPMNCSFPKLAFVLLLKCRDMNGDIMEAIKEQLMPEDIRDETWRNLSDFIKDCDNQERILIIMDGLDELPEKSRQGVHKLLSRRILPFCYILVTSRQERGIEARKNFEFDLLLEIKGFKEEDAFNYIRKHFQNVGPEHTSKGESLILEIRENASLSALRNNPLNLILLCVVYEDYKGKLPTARTALYQIVVQCLLRRYCAKNRLVAPEENSALEKQFEEAILALGQLAWISLLGERHGFRETELAELEIRYNAPGARDIGLLYKEESLKRLNPQHEYYFLHKTFQEYLAAAYIAHKLRENQLSLFERLSFHDLVTKYSEVFLFVSGILGREASILFTQIGEELKNWGQWDWDTCTLSGVVGMANNWGYFDDGGEAAATFFTDSFKESGHDEQMAVTLCSHIPFPQHVDINLYLEAPMRFIGDGSNKLFQVLDACKNFQNIQQPVEVSIYDSFYPKWDYEFVAECIQSCSQLQILNILTPAMTIDLANVLHNGLSGNTSLSEFTLQVCGSIPCDVAVVVSKWLAARKSLKKVTFLLDRVWGEAWASVIETGLCADTLLTSVDLEPRGLLSNTAIHALGKLSSNEALTSFSLNISGDLQDLLAAVVGKGIARQTALKVFVLNVNGKLSFSGVNFLQDSLMENRSLSDLKLTIHGEIPDNWQSVVENLRLMRKGSVSCSFHPDSCSRVTDNQVAYYCPAVVAEGLPTKQHLAVVLWGELSCNAAEALCQVLARTLLTSLTLKVHGKLTYGVANYIAGYVRQNKTLSSLTINIYGESTPGTVTFLEELSGNNVTVQVKVNDVIVVSNESCNSFDVSIEGSASLTSVFSEFKDTSKEKISVRIVNDGNVIKDWPHLLAAGLAENTSLTALDLTVDNYTEKVDLGRELGDSFLRSSSLTVLSLVISNYSVMAEGWECTLVSSLAKVTSLTTLSLEIDDRGEVRKYGGLVKWSIAWKSLSTLSVVINDSNLDQFWSNFLRNCLEGSASLKKLCLTANNFGEEDKSASCVTFPSENPEYWGEGLADGLARTTSLNELTLTINNFTSTDYHWAQSVCEGLLENESLTTLIVTVSDYRMLSAAYWAYFLKAGLRKNETLTTLTLTVNDYSEFARFHGSIRLPGFLFYSIPEKNTSLTELNLNVNICSEVSEDWLPDLCEDFLESSSLKTLRLKVNDQCATSVSRLYDLSQFSLTSGSLSSFELTVIFYGE